MSGSFLWRDTSEASVHSTVLRTYFVSFLVKVSWLQLFHYLPHDFNGGLIKAPIKHPTKLHKETADDRIQEWISLKEG